MFVGVVAFWGVYGIIFWLATPVEPVRLGLPEVAGMTIGALALTLVARLIALGFRWVYRKMFPGKRSRQRVSG